MNGRIRGRRGARLAAITSGGAIPETANYLVVAEPEGSVVGTLDEDFAIESLAGDVFLLGTTSWRIRRVEPGRVRVEDAHGAAPSIPFWLGEAPGRTAELSAQVSAVREEIARRQPAEAAAFLQAQCGLDRLGAGQAVDYVRAGLKILGDLPSERTIVAERFFDEAGGMQLVIHAPFGARINRAWGLALRKRFCRSFNFELQAAATDNGINISLTEQHSFPLEVVFEFVKPETVEHVLTQALLDSPMFTARWRWNASRALAVLRFAGGSKVPPPIQRMRSDDLLASVFPDQVACAENLVGEPRIPDHPLVRETIGNCLHEAMDLEGLTRILRGISEGRIRTVAVDTAEPSPFCHEILNANPYAYLDDAPLEERRARAVQLRRTLRTEDAAGVGALDAKAIEEVAQESWPVVRDADELHDALLTLIAAPPAGEWQEWFGTLRAAGRATSLRGMWVAAERLELARKAYAGAIAQPALSAPPAVRAVPETEEECAAEIVRGWLESTGPVASRALAERLSLPGPLVEAALARLEAEGQILRGRFTPAAEEAEWCHRRLLARIHRLTLGRLRREIEPVGTLDFMRFLGRWQHLAPGTQLHGPDGLLQVIRQLQGYEISAATWEPQILARRISRYTPDLLDQLCLSGEVMWGRLSPHPAFEAEEPRRVRPTRTAPLTLLLREDAGWLLALPEGGPGTAPATLSHPARDVLSALERRGASFFAELARDSGRLPSEVEDGLWELVAAGLVTADGFENLRSLIDPKRRRGEGRGRTARPRHAAGRWALLRHPDGKPDVKAFALQMLRRWGVVFRDLMHKESLAPAWRDLLVELRRMEAQGEIRGGRFVSGFVGEQYALPEALDLLRAIRRSASREQTVNGNAAERREETGIADPAAGNGQGSLEVSTSDPLNLSGIILPGPRLNPMAGGTLRLY